MIAHSIGQRLQTRQVRRKGSSTVQLAFVAPVFFGMVFGIIEVGRALMVTHLLTNAARQGCRLGVIEGKSTSDITTAVTNGLTTLGINGENATVQVNDNVADASNAKAGDEITVVVSVPVNKITWMPVGLFLKGNVSGQYTLRRE